MPTRWNPFFNSSFRTDFFFFFKLSNLNQRVLHWVMLAGWLIPMHNFWAVMNAGTLGVLGRSKQSMPDPNNGSHSAGPGRTKRVTASRTHACFWMENRGLCFLIQMQKLALHATCFCDVCWMQFCRNFCVRRTGQQAATPRLWTDKTGQQLMSAFVLILNVFDYIKAVTVTADGDKWLWDEEPCSTSI